MDFGVTKSQEWNCNGICVIQIRNNSSAKCVLCAKGCSDIYGVHDSQCAGGCRLWKRHRAIQKIIYGAAKNAQLDAYMETPNLFFDSSNDRPADVLLPPIPGCGSKRSCVDVSVTSAFSALSKEKSAIQIATDLKNKRYLEKCNKNNLHFSPFILDSLGNIGPDALKIIDFIGSAAADLDGSNKGKLCYLLKQRIIFNTVSYSAAAIIEGKLRSRVDSRA